MRDEGRGTDALSDMANDPDETRDVAALHTDVVDRLSATTRYDLIPALSAHLDRFEIVHVVGGEEGTILLRMLSAPRTALRTIRP